ncbi:transposase [Burkholderia sp. Ac-20344]|nr:transposase [Burkholderia sp. Ac-20344]
MMCPVGHEGHATKTCKFTEEQIAFALKQAELGTKVEEICRKLGMSEAAFYNERMKLGDRGIPIYADCDSLKKRTRSSSGSWQT